MRKFCSLIGILLFVTSCSNNLYDSIEKSENNEKSINLNGISVVNLADYNGSKTRSKQKASYVLRFSNDKTFENTVGALKAMSLDQQIQFYNQLEFQPAFIKLMQADEELDRIFDIDNDEVFLEEYIKFQERHNGQFVYNSEDPYDLSPYLTYSDERLSLVGDIHGQIIIGEKLIQPKNDNPTYHEFFDEDDFTEISENVYVKNDVPKTRVTGPIKYEPTFLSYADASIMIKKGKYRSTMTVGRLPDVESGRMTVRYASQKKKKLWKRRHKTTYQGSIRLNNGINIPFNYGLSKSEVLVISGVYRPEGRFYLHMNFTSGCCSGVQGNKELWCQ